MSIEPALRAALSLLARDPRALTCVLGIVYRCIAGHLIGKARLTRQSAATGAVTFIQRFGSALNLNIHFHMLFLDGVYHAGHTLRFQPLAAPSPEELQSLGVRGSWFSFWPSARILAVPGSGVSGRSRGSWVLAGIGFVPAILLIYTRNIYMEAP